MVEEILVGGGWGGEQQKSYPTKPRFSCGGGGVFIFYNIYNINIKQRTEKWG